MYTNQSQCMLIQGQSGRDTSQLVCHLLCVQFGVLPWSKKFFWFPGSYYFEYTTAKEGQNKPSVEYAGQHN